MNPDSMGARVHPVACRQPLEKVAEGQFVHDGSLSAHDDTGSSHQAEQHLQSEGHGPEDGDTRVDLFPHGLKQVVGVVQPVCVPLVKLPPGVARFHGFVQDAPGFTPVDVAEMARHRVS